MSERRSYTSPSGDSHTQLYAGAARARAKTTTKAARAEQKGKRSLITTATETYAPKSSREVCGGSNDSNDSDQGREFASACESFVALLSFPLFLAHISMAQLQRPRPFTPRAQAEAPFLDTRQIGWFIGKEGSSIKHLQEQLGVHMRVDAERVVVILRGDEERVKLAQAEVKKRIQQRFKEQEEREQENQTNAKVCPQGSHCGQRDCRLFHPKRKKPAYRIPASSSTEKRRNKNKTEAEDS